MQKDIPFEQRPVFVMVLINKTIENFWLYFASYSFFPSHCVFMGPNCVFVGPN